MFLNAMEFINQPLLGIPRLHVAYESDLTREGTIKRLDLSAQHAKSIFANDSFGSYKNIDLEPGPGYKRWMQFHSAWATKEEMAASAAQATRIIAGMRTSYLDNLSWYNSFLRSPWQDPMVGLRKKNDEIEELEVWSKLDALSFSAYRFDIGSDEACDYSLERTVREAVSRCRRLKKGLHVWVATNRQAEEPTLEPQILRSDIIRIAGSIQPKYGDRIVLWSARAAQGTDGIWRGIPWEVTPQMRVFLTAISVLG